MDKEKLEGLLIDYIDGKLNEADKAIVERELVQNKEAYQTYEQLREVMNAMEKSERLEPRARLKASFDNLLQEEIAKLNKSKTISLSQPVMYRMAAGVVLVMVGIGMGYWINKNQLRENEMLALKREVQATKQMMLVMMDNQQSASQRIQGVNVARKIDRADDEVVRALSKMMNEDPNTNVRLAALDALSKFHEEPLVRKELIQALGKQKDPVVQIALIQLMVRMKEKRAAKDLERIIEDTETMKAVKDEAYTGLLKLS